MHFKQKLVVLREKMKESVKAFDEKENQIFWVKYEVG